MRLEVEVGKTAGGRRRVACRAAAARLRVQLAPPQVIALRRLSVLSAHWSGWEAAVRARYPSAAPYPVPHLTPTRRALWLAACHDNMATLKVLVAQKADIDYQEGDKALPSPHPTTQT